MKHFISSNNAFSLFKGIILTLLMHINYLIIIYVHELSITSCVNYSLVELYLHLSKQYIFNRKFVKLFLSYINTVILNNINLIAYISRRDVI